MLLERLMNHGANNKKKNGLPITFTLSTEEISSLLYPTAKTINNYNHQLREPSVTVKLFAIFSTQLLIANRLQMGRLTSTSWVVRARFTFQTLQATSDLRLLKMKLNHSSNEYLKLIKNLIKKFLYLIKTKFRDIFLLHQI